MNGLVPEPGPGSSEGMQSLYVVVAYLSSHVRVREERGSERRRVMVAAFASSGGLCQRAFVGSHLDKCTLHPLRSAIAKGKFRDF